jgi:hypothetical protein
MTYKHLKGAQRGKEGREKIKETKCEQDGTINKEIKYIKRK